MVVEESKFRKRVGTFLNISIVVFILALTVVLAKTYIFTTEPKIIKAGDRVSSSGISWEGEKQSILLFLRSDCQYCTKSADFYKDIAKMIRQTANTRIIAVFSQNDARSIDYLNELGLQDINSIKANYAELGITGTPTVALIDDAGIVQNLWRGKLSRKQEVEFKQKLGIKVDDWYIEESEVADFKKNAQKVTIIDVQEREFYAKKHFQNAKNIPLDELAVRAVNEVSISDTVIVYGIFESDSDKAQQSLADVGFPKVYILNYSFQNPDSQVPRKLTPQI